jgi:hypothetical protein
MLPSGRLRSVQHFGRTTMIPVIAWLLGVPLAVILLFMLIF